MAARHGDLHRTRTFSVGAFDFVVETANNEDREFVEALFQDIPRVSGETRSPSILSLVRADDAGRSWFVASPRSNARETPTLSLALDLLVADVNLCALDSEPDHLHLHAAAAVMEKRAVVIAAPRNTGKTTTVAHLAARGWGVVTDETVRLPADGHDISGFPKPLSIKPGAREHVEHLEPWMIPPVGDGPEEFRFVPIGASGAAVVEGGAPHVVIVLRRALIDGSDCGAVAQRLHPADAVVALMQETLDAERFGRSALRLATLAATSHCFELWVGTPTETVDQIETLFRLDRSEQLEVDLFPASTSFSPGVVSVAVGDRAVVHDTASGRIFALDEGATRVWKALGGWPVDEDIDVGAPVIEPFVAQLRSLGVLAGAG